MKKKSKIILTFFILAIGLSVAGFFLREKRSFNSETTQIIILNDNEIKYNLSTQAKNVSSLLEEQGINLQNGDEIIPEEDSPIFSGMLITIQRIQKIKIEVDDREIESQTLAKTVREVIRENELALGRLDRVYPSLDAPPREKETIIITRINVEEKTVQEDINFKTTTKTDSKLGWREEKIEQKGKPGIMEIKYKITYRDSVEISRVVLEKNILEDPTTEIVTKGTKVKLGDTHTGLGTWYAQPSGIQKAYPSLTGYYVANPWLDKGSYVKITNKANGKSIIAVVNDRGPFGENRIVDLDKKAFAAIASLGAGVIDVKVEEVLN